MSTTTTPQGFDADERAKARADAGVTIGGRKYQPVRKTTEVMRDIRAIGREQERRGRAAERLEREADKLMAEADKAPSTTGAEELEERADALIEQADEFRDAAGTYTFVMLARLLTDGRDEPLRRPLRENGRELELLADPDALERGLDLTDAQELAGYLMPSADDDEPDPTAPTATTTT